MRASTYSAVALAAFAHLASAKRILILWEQIVSQAGTNDYPYWRTDTGDIDLCNTAPDCDWGDSQMDNSGFLYRGDPPYARIDSKCDSPTIDIYRGDDGVHRPYIAGGDGSEVGTCEYNIDWVCNDFQAIGSVNRQVILICDLNI